MTNAKTWLLLLLYALVSMVKGLADCPTPVLNTTYLLSEESLLKNSFPDHSEAVLQCANGYIYEAGSTSILCTDGKWSEVELKCKKKDCGEPKPLPHMTYKIPDGTLFGAYAKPTCEKGYRLQGSSYRQCLVHGWTGRPKCLLITCEQLAEIEHGKILTQLDQILLDQVIEFSCDAGYVLVGEKSITCDEYGEYSSPPPTCKAINCTVPEVMSGIQIKGSPPYSYKSQATFKCLSGYSMNGSHTVVCEERGWSALPVCVKDINVHTTASITSIPTNTTMSSGSQEEKRIAYPSSVIIIVICFVLAVIFLICGIIYVFCQNKQKGSYNTGEERRTKGELLLSQSKLKNFQL